MDANGKRTAIGGIVAICLVLLIVPMVSAAPVLYQQFGTTADTAVKAYTGFREAGQTWKATAGCFDTVEYRVDISGGAGGGLWNISIVQLSGGWANGVPIDSAAYNDTINPSGLTNVTLLKRLCSGVDFTIGTTYGVRYLPLGGDAVNNDNFRGETGNPYAGGNWQYGWPLSTNGTADDAIGALWDSGGGAANSTQTVEHFGDTYTDVPGEDQAGTTNATHFDEAFHWSFKPDSAIGMDAVEVYVKNVSGGGYYLHYNETSPANATAFNTTAWTAPALTEEGLCVYAIVVAVNGSQDYSNATECDYMSFYDVVEPNIVISTPATGQTYTVNNAAALNAMCDDTYLLNCTMDYYWYGNGSAISSPYWKNQAATAGTNTTLYYNETLWDEVGGNKRVSLNISAMDSHTNKALPDDWKFKVKNKYNIEVEGGVKIKNSDSDVVSISVKEKKDRFEYTYNFNKVKKKFTETIIATSPITIVANSEYPCHLTWGYSWWDAEEASKQGWVCSISRINSTAVEVDYDHVTGLNNLDPATGGMNWNSLNITYTLINYTTNVSSVFLNATSPAVGQTVQVGAYYNYTNGTAIAGANCNVTVEDPTATNTTYALNTSYLRNYQFNSSGSHIFFVECGTPLHDNAWNQTTLSTQGLSLDVFDEESLSVIQNWNVTISNSTQSMASGPNNNTFLWPNYTGGIPTGAITLTFKATGYEDRTYFATYTAGSGVDLDAYLLLTTSGVFPIFIVRDQSTYSALPGTTLTFRKLIGGAFITVAQAITDATGTAQVFLDPSTSYRLTVVRTGYNTYTSSAFIPVATTYVIGLNATTGVTYNNVSNVLYQIIRPQASTQIQWNGTLEFECNDPWSNVGIFWLYVVEDNGTTMFSQNGTSASCGIITVNGTTLGVANYSGFTAYGVVNRNGQNYTISKRYTVGASFGGGFTQDLFNASLDPNFDLNTRSIIAFFIAMMAVIATSVTGIGLSQVGTWGSAFVGLAVLGFFVIVNWFNPLLFIFTFVVVILAYATKEWRGR